MPNTSLGELCALLAPMAWSVAVIFFKRSSAPPLSLNLFKNCLGLVLLSITMVGFGISIPRDRSAEDWARVVLSGILGLAVADTLFFEGIRRIGAARFALVDTIYAPLIVLLSWVLLGEVPGTAFLAGGVAVVAGVTIASVDPRELRFQGGREVAVGMLYALLGIAGTAVGVIVARPVLQRSELVEVTWSRLVAGLLAMGVWIVVRGRGAEAAEAFRPGPLWKNLVPGSFFGTYLSLLLWLGGFKWAPAAVAAVLNQMATVYLLVFARLVLKEKIAPRQAAGSLLAAAGAGWIVLSRVR